MRRGLVYSTHSGTMAATVTIPNRRFFRSAEVCAIAGVQPYVLNSWAAEFPALDGARSKAGARVYERAQVELVLRIKELVFGEALTLGAARRRLEAEQPAAAAEPPDGEAVPGELFGNGIRPQVAAVEQELRDLLEILDGEPGESAAETSGAAGE